ncbi:MAG: glycosyltransferase family 4 protein [Candidatus Omnitrophica bacterium]|nr:glycosyltransferase family 4 protein [Candidatus Omnitrophota bacterium]
MRKIKVLHIITRLIVGGAQDIALSIANQLDKDKFDVTFISGPQDFSREMVDKWNIDVTIIPDLIREINPLKDLKVLARLYFFIKKNRFDIVHTHTSKAGILGRVAAKLASTPIIFHTPHGSIFHSIYYGPKTLFFISRLENFVASFTDKIINCAENEKRDFLEHKIASVDKYITIYWGIKQNSFLKTFDSNLKRRELNIPKDAVLIGNITRLAPEKGHIFCLEAFKMVVNRFPRAKLLIVGDGISRQDIETKIKELDLESSVIMTGHRTDVADMLANLDISLHTSIWEGTPIAIIEAMLSGKAIIATKVGGIPELIEDGVTGILITPYDKEELLEAITTLINDKILAKKIGEAARQYAKEKFSLELMIKNITSLYNSFIESKNKFVFSEKNI